MERGLDIQVLQEVETAPYGARWKPLTETVKVGSARLRAEDWILILRDLEERGLVKSRRSKALKEECGFQSQATVKIYFPSARGHQLLESMRV